MLISMIMHSPGNMIEMPKPGSETTRLWAVYDAWNRLVEIHQDDGDGTKELGTDDDLLVTHEYDGLHRRVRRIVEGTPDVEYDHYYNTNWQVLETRRDEDADPLKQFIWDLRYIDSPIVRFRDGNTDGDYADAGDDVLYYVNDGSFSVTALIDATSGSVVERYEYTPYGERTVLQADFADHATDTVEGSYDNRLGFQGLAHDFETGLIHQRTRPRRTGSGGGVTVAVFRRGRCGGD